VLSAALAFRLALPIFFASGMAALIYQVVWQRLLVVFSGADLYSATLVVAAFMAGLGVGHLAGGHVADRVASRSTLFLFAAAELGIGIFGFFSDALYYDLLYQRFGHVDAGPVVTGAILFASLLIPTLLMGASLPLLARALTSRLERAATTIGSLYAVNTIGAAVGAIAATWWLIPRGGLSGSLSAAALLNIACALMLFPMAWLLRSEESPAVAASVAADRTETPAGAFFSGWLLVYALCGFIALSLEIVWFRLLGVMMKSSAFTFGTLLALYLTGLGLGGLAGSRLAPRVRRPAVWFFSLQAGIGVVSGLLLVGLTSWWRELPALQGYFAAFEPMDVGRAVAVVRSSLAGGGLEGIPEARLFLLLYLGLPLAVILPPTFLMGCSFPVLQRVVQTDPDAIGRRVGTLLMANVCGSLAGAMVTGWVLLDIWGTGTTVRVLVASAAVFAALAAWQAVALGAPVARASLGSLGAVACAALLVAVMPPAHSLWASLHGTLPSRLIVVEDGSGLTAIRFAEMRDQREQAVVFSNGLGQSYMPYGSSHTALGAVPAFVHGAPRTAAVIGLGSGATVHSIAGHPAIERVLSIEINRTQLVALRQAGVSFGYPALRDLLADHRIQHIFADGRRYLMRTAERFDLIEADALRPTSAYSGNLYSAEYFDLMRRRLNPGGLAVTWNATPRVETTFLAVFPHVVGLPEMLLGSNEPIALEPARIRAQLASDEVRRYYDRAGTNIERLVLNYVERPVIYAPATPRPAPADINRDLRPRDEFDLVR
jgi:spermidine synthase